jgi:hypothetical protein
MCRGRGGNGSEDVHCLVIVFAGAGESVVYGVF